VVSKDRPVMPIGVLVVRFAAIVLVLLVGSGGVAATAATPLTTPPCPQVEGWTFGRTFGPIDQGLGVQFSCNYSIPGFAEQLTLDVIWIKPQARDVDVDYTQCGRASQSAPNYRFIYSGSNLAREQYIVNGGTTASNAARFQADRERIERAALTFFAATEKLAKSCAKTSTPRMKDTIRPTVRTERASGVAGAVVTFPFSVSDNSGKVRVMLTIYRAPNKAKLLFRKDYGFAKSGRNSVTIRVRNAATNLWCITATDAASNATTACNSLVVRP
jgi:hypothetical protein